MGGRLKGGCQALGSLEQGGDVVKSSTLCSPIPMGVTGSQWGKGGIWQQGIMLAWKRVRRGREEQSYWHFKGRVSVAGWWLKNEV